LDDLFDAIYRLVEEMAGRQIKGKGLKAFVKELGDGFSVLNPLVLKQFDATSYKPLHQELKKRQNELRSQPYPSNEPHKIRQRNLRLQRLHGAMTILEHAAKEKRIPLF